MAELARVGRKLDVFYDEDGDTYEVKRVLRDMDTGETFYWMEVSCSSNDDSMELRKLNGLYTTDPTEETEDA